MPGSASPPFFLTIVVVQNVPLLMTESSMATGCDMTESGCFPLSVILIVRGVVSYAKGVFHHVQFLTVVFLLNNRRVK